MSNKRKALVIICFLIMANLLISNVSLERQGNEAAAEGDTYYEESNFIEAARKYEEALNFFMEAEEVDQIPLDDKIDQMLTNMVASYFQAQDFNSTIRAVSMQLERDPGNDTLARTIAQIYERQLNNPGKAIEVLEKFNENHKNRTVKNRLANLYLSLNDDQNALKWFNKTFEMRPDAEILQNIALLYYRTGDTESAIKAYEDFIATNPRDTVLERVYLNLGRFYDDIGNEARAIEYLELTNEMRFKQDVTILLLTKYFDSDDFSNAQRMITKLLNNDPNNPHALYHRAMIKHQQGDLRGAKADFERVAGDRMYGSSARRFIESIESEL